MDSAALVEAVEVRRCIRFVIGAHGMSMGGFSCLCLTRVEQGAAGRPHAGKQQWREKGVAGLQALLGNAERAWSSITAGASDSDRLEQGSVLYCCVCARDEC